MRTGTIMESLYVIGNCQSQTPEATGDSHHDGKFDRNICWVKLPITI